MPIRHDRDFLPKAITTTAITVGVVSAIVHPELASKAFEFTGQIIQNSINSGVLPSLVQEVAINAGTIENIEADLQN